MQLGNPLEGLPEDADFELKSCKLDLVVDWRWFSGSQTSNTLVIEQATKFDELATWNNNNKYDHSSAVYANGATKLVTVSCATLGGGCDSGGWSGDDYILPSIDLTALCKEMLITKKYLLYFSLKDKCTVSGTRCMNEVLFHGVRSSSISKRPKMTWELKGK